MKILEIVKSKTDRAGVPCLFFYAVKISERATVFLYRGLKIRADCGIIGNIINVRECSHKSEFVR